MSFPSGSSRGTDGLLPQHLKDLIGPAAEVGAVSVFNVLTALITFILEHLQQYMVCCLVLNLQRSQRKMVAFTQLLWGVPSGGLLLNVHAFMLSTLFQISWLPTN